MYAERLAARMLLALLAVHAPHATLSTAPPPARLAGWRLQIDMTQPPVTFWNATVDGCPNYHGLDAIDETLAAFRTAGGQIRMVGGNGVAGPLSFVGDSLLTLKRDCATGPVIHSRNNYSGPADFPHNMWLPATWAMEDGVTVHGLVHDEFHTNRATVDRKWCVNVTANNRTECAGWASSVISVISTDGGKSFSVVTSDERPRGIAIGAPIPYLPTYKNLPTIQGMPAHRSMVRSPKDQFWYTMPSCAYLTQLGKPKGKCVFRTANISDPASWVGWNGSSWSVPGALPTSMLSRGSACAFCLSLCLTTNACMVLQALSTRTPSQYRPLTWQRTPPRP
jgi:hypothetical protein